MTTTTATVHTAYCGDHDGTTGICLAPTRYVSHALIWASGRPGQEAELHMYVTDPDRPWTTGEWDALTDAMCALRADATA